MHPAISISLIEAWLLPAMYVFIYIYVNSPMRQLRLASYNNLSNMVSEPIYDPLDAHHRIISYLLPPHHHYGRHFNPTHSSHTTSPSCGHYHSTRITFFYGAPNFSRIYGARSRWGYLDGTKPAPMKMITTSSASGAAQIVNPDYTRWYDQDQHLLSGILSTMLEDTLPDVVTATFAKEVRDSLQTEFALSTRARTLQIHIELATARKQDLTTADYFHKI